MLLVKISDTCLSIWYVMTLNKFEKMFLNSSFIFLQSEIRYVLIDMENIWPDLYKFF